MDVLTCDAIKAEVVAWRMLISLTGTRNVLRYWRANLG
jgi:hypothetical protein